MNLSDNHKRAVFSTLKIVEKRIGEIEALILKGNGITVRIDNDLSKEETNAVLNICNATKEAIENMVVKYDMKPTVIVLSGAINTLQAFNWNDLAERDIPSLMKYGDFTPEENSKELEKDLNHIVSLTEQLVIK